MNNYEAKGHYQSKDIAQKYDAQFNSPLRLSNLRAKLVGWGEEKAFMRLLKQAPAGGNVLDIACGTGRYTELLMSRGYKVGGIDISVDMMEFAKRQIGSDPNLLFLQKGDAENLSFEDNQFDGVTCMRLYHRVPPTQRLQMLQEVKRVASGWAILFFGMSTPWLNLRQTVRSKLLTGLSSNPYPVSPGEIKHELQSLGFSLKDSVWVLPYITGGMIVYVRWCINAP